MCLAIPVRVVQLLDQQTAVVDLDGIRKEISLALVDGVQEGATVVFHPNGQTYYTGDYRHGHEVGEWRFFDERGTLVRTVRYDSTGAVINDR